MQELIKPEWIKVKYRTNENIEAIKRDVKVKGLVTVCQEARCPNIWECWQGGTATFMLMGDTCTRGCSFCSVKTAKIPAPLDPNEPQKLVESVKRMNLSYVVITTVDRDDLPDQGAAHLARCITTLKEALPKLKIEILIGDFQGDLNLLQQIIDAQPDVISHNLETVRELTKKVRDCRATYDQSLHVLKAIKKIAPHIYTKSSLMLGFKETKEQVEQSMDDLRAIGVDFLTLGQYLRPSQNQLQVKEYVPTDTFKYYEKHGNSKGFVYVASGPFVRSSYKAGELFIASLLNKKEV